MSSLKKYVSKQSGGTLTGFIIGLVIGLSIAVVVALVINKSSTPFTNKNGVADKSEALTTQMQDPNKPLYGNKVSVDTISKELPKPADNASSQLVPKPDSASVKTNIIEDKSIYFLQVGAFSTQNDADSARARLALTGIEASVSEKNNDGALMYRVRVGPFDSAETMNKMRAKLTENNVETSIIKSTK
jgi:cell division protein FtsN